jgi:hypothetical protein
MPALQNDRQEVTKLLTNAAAAAPAVKSSQRTPGRFRTSNQSGNSMAELRH